MALVLEAVRDSLSMSAWLDLPAITSVLTPPPMQDAKRGVLFKSFPPVLFLQLKRFEFDYERGITVKVRSFAACRLPASCPPGQHIEHQAKWC